MAREITPVNVVRNPAVRAAGSHCRNRSCNWRRCSRSSVVSSCAKYASVRYVRGAETRAVSPRKHPLRDAIPLASRIEEAPKNSVSLLNAFRSELRAMLVMFFFFLCAWLDNRKKNVLLVLKLTWILRKENFIALTTLVCVDRLHFVLALTC